MAYFIFTKDADNLENVLFKIAENQSDLNNLIIDKSIYKIIEVNQTDFDDVKYGKKIPTKYNQNVITYLNLDYSINGSYFTNKSLNDYIFNFKKNIKQFLNNNKNHTLFNLWNNYYNQLDSLNTLAINYPLEKTLEQYFKDQNQTSLSPLQIP